MALHIDKPNFRATVFEHMLPMAVVRDLLIDSRLTVAQALHSPTCWV